MPTANLIAKFTEVREQLKDIEDRFAEFLSENSDLVLHKVDNRDALATPSFWVKSLKIRLKQKAKRQLNPPSA